MNEIRFHGRGGQGAVTAATLLAIAGYKDGKFTQAFPKFGVERRGAPVEAFTRISNKFIRRKCGIYNPDILVVLDSTLLGVIDITAGLKEDGIIILNTKKTADELALAKGKIFTVDASSVALKVLNQDIVNTAMLGAFAAITKLVSREAILEAVKEHFTGDLQEKNLYLVNQVYEKAEGCLK